MARPKLADISVEVCHLYLNDLTKETAAARAAACATWLRPHIERWRSANLVVSTTIMVDDYFSSRWLRRGNTAQEAGELMSSACSTFGLDIDFLCFESACVPIAERMHRRLVARPREGTGSRGGPDKEMCLADDDAWLSNGDVFRKTYSGGFVSQVNKTVDVAQDPEGRHALFLDTELFNKDKQEKRVWSCPALAAAWQLARLGITMDKSQGFAPPAGTIAYSSKLPFVARRTLTMLPTRMLPVEHAVHTILGSMDLVPADELNHLAYNEMPVNLAELIQRIGYFFIDDHFDPLLRSPSAKA